MKPSRTIEGRKVKQNGKLWDVVGVGRDSGKVVFTGTLTEIKKALRLMK